MLQSNRAAFKEWASIVEVLGKGEQALILRKGGIHEKGKKFDVAHEEFFLFPTFEHQKESDLKPEKADLFRKVLSDKPPSDKLPLRFYCQVVDSFWISEERKLQALQALHVWSWDCVKARFDWGDEKGIFGIIVRVHSLPQTLVQENLARYGGCRSWVDLEQPIDLSSTKPVLPAQTFDFYKDKILQAIA